MTSRDSEADGSLSRRSFIGAGASAALAVKTGAAFAQLNAGFISSGAQTQTPAFALDELTIDDLQKRMRDGTETAHSLAQQYLARIDAIDQRGPSINSVIELNPDALAIAAELDAERKGGKLRGPLHGIPGVDQGQHRHGGQDAHDRRIARARRQHRGARFVRRRAVARGGRGDIRKDESQRVGELSLGSFVERVERAWRTDAQSIRAR